jgi:hypothetical protein
VNKKHLYIAFYLVKYKSLKFQVHKRDWNKLEEKKCLKHKDVNFRWMRSSLLVSVIVTLFQTDEAYSNRDLT